LKQASTLAGAARLQFGTLSQHLTEHICSGGSSAPPIADLLERLQYRVAALEEENANLRVQLHESKENSRKKEAELQDCMAMMMDKLNMK